MKKHVEEYDDDENDEMMEDFDPYYMLEEWHSFMKTHVEEYDEMMENFDPYMLEEWQEEYGETPEHTIIPGK